MDGPFAFWNALDARRRIVLVLAGAATIAAVLMLARVASKPAMTLLYAGLEPAAAGEVSDSLAQMDVPFEIRGNSIYVPDNQRDRVRMSLATQGLPATGPAGYELLDGLTGFGTTSDMFDAAYWRAKEGELARTILASPGVRSARVHIANPSRRPFSRDTRPSASVTVAMAGGASLGKSQALAIRFLTASAVAGLEAQMVAVIDGARGVVLRPGDGEEDTALASNVQDREAKLRSEIEQLLSARVGEGKVQVRVNLETSLESEVISQRIIDPENRVAISTDTQEASEQAEGTGGAVTVASNLPDGDAQGGGDSSSNRTELRERVNFEFSETRREQVRRAGEVKRIAVAVLVDGVEAPDANGEIQWQPRSQDELQALSQLVRTAIGFTEERGDVVTVESLQFAAPPTAGEVAEAGAMDFLGRNAMTLLQMGVLSIVALVLGLSVVRPILSPPPATEGELALAGGLEATLLENSEAAPGLEGDGSEAVDSLEPPPDPLEVLRLAVEEKGEESASILRDWLETQEAEEPTG